MGYTKDFVKGISWVGSVRIVIRILTFLKTIILARLLIPAQYGVFGIATLVLTLIEIITETGINIFLVQQKEDIKEFIDTAWVVSILRGITISIGIFISIPFISAFFHAPEAKSTLLLMCLVPLIRGFINPAVITFQKNLRFEKEFVYRTSVFFVETLLSVYLVFITGSVNGLVMGMIVGCIFEVVITFILASPKPTFAFELEKFKVIIHKGKWITASTIFTYFYQNGDNMMVGRMLGTASLGVYDMGYKLSLAPMTDIANVVSTVTFPIYSRINDDRERLRKAFFKSFLAVILIILPITVILYLFSDQIVLLVLGEKWIQAAPVLKVLSLLGLLRSFTVLSSSLFLAFHEQRIVSVLTLLNLIGLFGTIIPLILQFGIVGAGYAALIGAILPIPAIFYFSRKYLFP